MQSVARGEVRALKRPGRQKLPTPLQNATAERHECHAIVLSLGAGCLCHSEATRRCRAEVQKERAKLFALRLGEEISVEEIHQCSFLSGELVDVALIEDGVPR